MSALTLQMIVAVALLCVALAYTRYARRRQGPSAPPVTYPDAKTYRTAIETLPEDCKAAETFSTNAAALFKTYADSVQAVDGKIGTLLGVVGGGTSVLALLGGTEKIARPPLTPLLILALLALAVVFYCALEGLRPQTRSNVNVAELCDVALLCSESGNSRMHALMGWEYLEATRNTVPILLAKADWLKRCYRAFAVGVIALVINALLPWNTPAPRRAVAPLSCVGSPGRNFNCTVDLSEVLK